jgi:hypothetical protein
MTSARILTSADRCPRKAFLERSWERNVLSPHEVLRRAVEAGLEANGEDPGQAAGDTAMTLCVERGLEVKQSDLFMVANNIAALADMTCWLLRQGGPWERPEDVRLGNHHWESSAFLNEAGTRLRAVLIADRWDDARELSANHSWFYGGEAAIYGMPLDLMVVISGQRRDGRWHGPLSKGWTHPVSKDLRFRKRDGSGFDSNWKQVFREDADYSREKWLDAMTQDGVLEDAIQVHQVDLGPHTQPIRDVAERILAQAEERRELPLPQLSQCFGISPCQFRDACWTFQPPSVELGFIRVGDIRQAPSGLL